MDDSINQFNQPKYKHWYWLWGSSRSGHGINQMRQWENIHRPVVYNFRLNHDNNSDEYRPERMRTKLQNMNGPSKWCD